MNHVIALLEQAIETTTDPDARAQYEAALAWHQSGDDQ